MNASDPNTITPEERAAYEEQERQRAMAETRRRAQAQASEFLNTQGVPGYGAPPGVQIGPPAPPPPPPPKPNMALITGPPAYAPREEAPKIAPETQAFKEGAQLSSEVQDKGIAKEVSNAPPEGGRPVDAPATGSLGVIPGGFYPDKMVAEAKLGKPVPAEARAAYGASTALGLDAAGKKGAADQSFHEQEKAIYGGRLAAAEAARADMVKLHAEKDAEVGRRLQEIEALNKQATIKPEDTFNDRILLGRMLGTLFAGLGVAIGGRAGIFAGVMSGGLMNGIIDQDIDSRLKAKKSLGDQAAKQTDLLGMYLKKFGDKERAIQATKLAYWDSSLAQLDQFAAEHQGRLDPIKVEERRAEILAQRGKTVNDLAKQEEADVTETYAQKYHMPQAVGGGGTGAGGPEGYTFQTPDGTYYNFADKELYEKAVKRQDLNNRLIDRNNEILKLRKATRELGFTLPGTKEYEIRQKNLALLKDIEEEKLSTIESAREQGVIREGEYGRKKELTGHATTGLEFTWDKALAGPLRDAEYAAGDAVLNSQTKRWEKDTNDYPKSATTPIVEHGYVRNPMTGELSPIKKYTGQTTGPDPRLAPHGSRSMDPKKSVNTMERPVKETTPQAQRFPYRYTPPTPSHHKKKK